MAKLDYDASVPINNTAPFSVQVDPNKPPGDRFMDYKPKNPQTPTKADDSVKKKNFMRPPVARYQQDYISPADSEAKRNSEKEAILIIAKQLYDDQVSRRVQYALAEKTIADSGASEEAIIKAKKIVERNKPLTKSECVEAATKQFYGLRT